MEVSALAADWPCRIMMIFPGALISPKHKGSSRGSVLQRLAFREEKDGPAQRSFHADSDRGPAWRAGIRPRFGPRSPVLGSIAVREDMRGQGVGRALLAAVEANARSEGVSHMTGFMDERNGVPSFYERTDIGSCPCKSRCHSWGPTR
ncbi:GNAT family N-acetyltransferase [Arthrobacter pascens]|uniref:GNAT family N-acetyltransferase n=1 Tax=Arthrobacter pascens TaxID=1677 RepID=UPI0035934DAE